MDFSEVIEQLKILNGHTERMSAGQLDLIQINQELIERIDALTGTVGDGIDTDIMLAKDAARRELVLLMALTLNLILILTKTNSQEAV